MNKNTNEEVAQKVRARMSPVGCAAFVGGYSGVFSCKLYVYDIMNEVFKLEISRLSDFGQHSCKLKSLVLMFPGHQTALFFHMNTLITTDPNSESVPSELETT